MSSLAWRQTEKDSRKTERSGKAVRNVEKRDNDKRGGSEKRGKYGSSGKRIGKGKSDEFWVNEAQSHAQRSGRTIDHMELILIREKRIIELLRYEAAY